MAKRKALITGITGQDGSYLAELLLDKGYEVHGLLRDDLNDDNARFRRLAGVRDRVEFHASSLDNFPSLHQAVTRVQPDECYHLAAQSFVSYSFADEFSTVNENIRGTHFMLASVKEAAPGCRFCFAGSSEMFGKPAETPQVETTSFQPRSVYGISKAAGFELARHYRETRGLFACSGILFNHESVRRGNEFVTRKISAAAAAIAAGKAHELRLGNLEARRDWGHAPDYVSAMWLMLQQDQPDDYVVATGTTHSVRDFCEAAFNCVGLDYRDYVVCDPKFYRPVEKELLVGDASKAKAKLGWTPLTTFEEIVRMMVEADCRALGIRPKA